ncbi:MAG: hypothetical protein II164_00900, partial [Firmicutes bacterium]|nr:hypothetical protein [Bacillota bacterium]
MSIFHCICRSPARSACDPCCFGQNLDTEYKELFVSDEGFSHKAFIESLKEDDEIILCGGDGTLYSVNNALIKSHKQIHAIAQIPCGSGNGVINSLYHSS